MRIRTIISGAVLAVALPAAASAQGKVSVEQLACLPLHANAPVEATVEGATAGASVRVYFRRLNNLVEDLYFVEARPSGGARWVAVLPRPEDHQLPEKDLSADRSRANSWAAWWKAKEASDHRDPNDDLDDEVVRERASVGKTEKRDWMSAQDERRLQEWLERLENEPAEYFAALYDSYGKPVARTEMRVVPVRADCPVQLTPVEEGLALNLSIGETSGWQPGEPIFHWQCDGIVTRIDQLGILRADEVCRACVVAWEMKNQFLVPVAGVLGTTVVTIIEDQPVSPLRPGPF